MTDEGAEYHYLEPKTACAPSLFDEFKRRSDLPQETFATLAASLHEMKDSCHQFQFKYPLRDSDQAALFARVMQIKAQEAHRFVPVIANCQFIEPRHLGFSRRVSIVDGPVLQEHVLIDTLTRSIIFVEEFAVTPEGEVVPGTFVALNSVIEEEGQWFFSGIYLYGQPPTEKQIQDRIRMFWLTYEAMIDFIEKCDVDLAFSELRQF
jgi:hypothetical protein